MRHFPGWPKYGSPPSLWKNPCPCDFDAESARLDPAASVREAQKCAHLRKGFRSSWRTQVARCVEPAKRPCAALLYDTRARCRGGPGGLHPESGAEPRPRGVRRGRTARIPRRPPPVLTLRRVVPFAVPPGFVLHARRIVVTLGGPHSERRACATSPCGPPCALPCHKRLAVSALLPPENCFWKSRAPV